MAGLCEGCNEPPGSLEASKRTGDSGGGKRKLTAREIRHVKDDRPLYEAASSTKLVEMYEVTFAARRSEPYKLHTYTPGSCVVVTIEQAGVEPCPHAHKSATQGVDVTGVEINRGVEGENHSDGKGEPRAGKSCGHGSRMNTMVALTTVSFVPNDEQQLAAAGGDSREVVAGTPGPRTATLLVKTGNQQQFEPLLQNFLTESYPAFARIGLRENPGKNLNQVTCPDRDSNPGHLVSQPDALTVTPQVDKYLKDLNRLPDSMKFLNALAAMHGEYISSNGSHNCALAPAPNLRVFQRDRQRTELVMLFASTERTGTKGFVGSCDAEDWVNLAQGVLSSKPILIIGRCHVGFLASTSKRGLVRIRVAWWAFFTRILVEPGPVHLGVSDKAQAHPDHRTQSVEPGPVRLGVSDQTQAHPDHRSCQVGFLDSDLSRARSVRLEYLTKHKLILIIGRCQYLTPRNLTKHKLILIIGRCQVGFLDSDLSRARSCTTPDLGVSDKTQAHPDIGRCQVGFLHSDLSRARSLRLGVSDKTQAHPDHRAVRSAFLTHFLVEPVPVRLGISDKTQAHPDHRTLSVEPGPVRLGVSDKTKLILIIGRCQVGFLDSGPVSSDKTQAHPDHRTCQVLILSVEPEGHEVKLPALPGGPQILVEPGPVRLGVSDKHKLILIIGRCQVGFLDSDLSRARSCTPGVSDKTQGWTLSGGVFLTQILVEPGPVRLGVSDKTQAHPDHWTLSGGLS
ncbi:hypothetical protein ANN_07942 [Periplaneta americana]|uniref:Uncharacterized protein n=1 Tax=Periplaneta americana TaxID=6978 RepID=A0ABQ8T029_PERAM|nr:hypothetical protein ANN_07942 [Periplaneta americana]